MANAVERLDLFLANLLSDWGFLTTVLALLIVALIAYPIVYPEEPDTHPLLLARQSAIDPVRNKYESAIYRSPEVPPGTPLKSGLNVKKSDQPRWASGRDGDLRDIWREVLKGGTKDVEGKEVSKGLIMTVLGKEELIEHDVAELSKETQVIGKHLSESGRKKVAIYLPNNIEYLLTIFACAFYNITPILLPYNLPHPKVYELINATSADALVSAAGNLPLDDVAQQCPSLRLLTWVVEPSSRHMDWNGVPDSAADHLTVSVWHDVVEEDQSKTTGELPTDSDTAPPEIITVMQPADLSLHPQIVSLTQANLVSAIASLTTALPLRQRISPADLVLAASSFSIPYILLQTLASLHQHASLAVTSVAQPGIELSAATRGISPTVILASPETLSSLHAKETSGVTTAARMVGRYSQEQAMSAGRMPTDGWLFRILAPSGNAPGKLRLILTYNQISAGNPPLTSTMLSDLRIFTRARICYALLSPLVAGAVAQSHVFDYRRVDGVRCAHFGLPLSSVEVKLVDKGDDGRVGSSSPEGQIWVRGPAVNRSEGKESGKDGWVGLGVRGSFGEDGCLALAE